MNTKQIESILTRLKKTFPQVGAMELGSPYQTIVGVLLSARTRDEQVLKLLPKFFVSFPTVQVLSQASIKQIESHINTIGMYRQKARHLKKMAQVVVSQFQGEIPSTMEELISLAGVGRKTASVVLVASFGKNAIAVDTHVHRVTNRLGWVKTQTPEKTEQALLKLIPLKSQPIVNRVFVKFGRSICLPGKPRCWMCPIRENCSFQNKQLLAPKNAEELLTAIERREAIVELLRKKLC